MEGGVKDVSRIQSNRNRDIDELKVNWRIGANL